MKNAVLQKVVAWVRAKGGVLHCLVIVYAAGFSWFKLSPAFHSVCVQVWTTFPSLVKSSLEALQQVLAIYGFGGAVKTTGSLLFSKKPTEDSHA